jgi:formamidopyrimidine-DNA glycosylase
MPELPEVETVARQLAPDVEGRRLERVRFIDPLLKAAGAWRAPRPYRGRLIERVVRYGKQVVFTLAPGDLHLAIHLRMTGRLRYSEGGWRDRQHLRAVLQLGRGVVLFHDVRRFGTISWLTDIEQAAPGAVDPLSGAFTVSKLACLLEGCRQELKPWLLRQDRLVGLGNIYASEILHAARLSPLRPAGSLSPSEIRRLHSATRRVLAGAIESCGTTFSDFQDAHGLTGSYQQYLAVYGREGEPCSRCREPVIRIVQQQRSTFLCPSCSS